ncbi:MAG: flagellar basal body rod protein FlgB [Phenylobacterium sp.]
MNLADIPLFSMLRNRLGYLGDRQRVIAENIANSDTPLYTPKDLKPFSFQASVEAVQMSAASAPARTQAGHMAGTVSKTNSGFRPMRKKDSETTLDGNSVVLEEETIKMADARMNYDAAISFYQKSLGLLRMAARAPGK